MFFVFFFFFFGNRTVRSPASTVPDVSGGSDQGFRFFGRIRIGRVSGNRGGARASRCSPALRFQVVLPADGSGYLRGRALHRLARTSVHAPVGSALRGGWF